MKDRKYNYSNFGLDKIEPIRPKSTKNQRKTTVDKSSTGHDLRGGGKR